MSLNPLNELKRHLEDDTTPLPKRLCLAKNLVKSHHFPTAPKERIISEWLEGLTKVNKLSSLELQKVLDWLSVNDLTGELKSRLIQIVAQYVQRNILQNNDIPYILTFLDNPKISSQICQQIDDYLTITITLLQHLKNNDNKISLCEKLLNNLLKYYKDSKKKLEFIIKFLEGKNLETVFSLLETECHETVVNVCQNILFPAYKKAFFISYLQTLIRKDNIEDLIAEKGDNIQSVLKIMSIFFEFPKHRTEMDPRFLCNFIDVFISCFRKESQVIYAFFIMVTNVLVMKQDHIIPCMKMKPITFEENDEKIKRNLFLSILENILNNEVDINVRLTDTFGQKVSKIEVKKNFLSFLQVVMIGQLKLEGKIDKVTLQIIKTALKLDPILIEQTIEEILPPIMASKKSSNIMEPYKDMLDCLLETLFKLSRGTHFLNQMLPLIKLNLEASDTEQIKIRQELKENAETGVVNEKLKCKLITGKDVFPQECVETFGRLTTELMFRQNKELLEILQKDFEVHCLLMLEEGKVSPSIVTLTEVLTAVLSSFFRYNKMSDHTVPQQIAEEFWSVFTIFEEEFLRRFGQCILKFIDNQSLLNAFLIVCLAYCQLKLLNLKYSNHKLNASLTQTDNVFDMSILLTCLTSEEWKTVAGKVEDAAVLDNLLLVKAMAIELLSIKEDVKNSGALVETKSHLIKELSSNLSILETDKYFPRVLFTNLEHNQYKTLAKGIVKLYLNDQLTEMFNDVAISNNRLLLNALVLETAKNVTKCMENTESLTKALNKSEFNMAAFAKDVNMKDYFNIITMAGDHNDKIKKCIEIFKWLKIPYLEENYQLTAIFVLLASKKCCQSKKVRKNIDYVLQNTFELSQHVPDLYLIFPADFIFSFSDTTLIELLTLKIKTANHLLVIKSLIEKAVKKVKADSGLIKGIVKLLTSKKVEKINSIETFSDPAFQMTCILLPLIVKQKKSITASAFRSILADLQDKLHTTLLETFQDIDFTENSSLFIKDGNTEDSVVYSDSNMAALNAIAAYTLTLSKYCETTNVEEIQNLDCLWSGLEFFIQNAIKSISNTDSKPQHIESSLQLLNIALRHIKKLDTHPIFSKKDKLFHQIWTSISARLGIVFQNEGSGKNCEYLEDLCVTLKFVCESVSVEGFEKFVGDLGRLVLLKKPVDIIKDETKSSLTNHLVSKYLWAQCLKANTVGPKCASMTKTMFLNCRNLKSWIRQHYDAVHNVANKKRKLEVYSDEKTMKTVKVHDDICNILRLQLDTLTEVIFAGKKIVLDYKFLDAIFELQHMVHYILGSNSVHLKCEITWESFFKLFEGCVAILNSLLVSREELLEDRWPCYMQCYRTLTSTLCERASSQVQLDRSVEDKLAESAHSIEKLTHAITKRKKQVSRIAAYTVADICKCLENNAPPKVIRQHLENSVAVLIQASDSSYAMAFLKRALAGSAGQMTMTNLYTMYKRYHKYTGNA